MINMVKKISQDIKHSIFICDYGFKHFNVVGTDGVQEKSFNLVVSKRAIHILRKHFLISTTTFSRIF